MKSKELRKEIARCAAELHELRVLRRKPPGGTVPREQRRRVTLLHLALANRRRKLHLRRWHGHEVDSLDQQEALLIDECLLVMLGR